MQIPLSQIAQVAKILLEAYQERGVESVQVNMDMYWIVDAPAWTNFNEQPKLHVGSLADDWESLQKVLAGQMPTVVDFDRLATVLRAISEHMLPRTPPAT